MSDNLDLFLSEVETIPVCGYRHAIMPVPKRSNPIIPDANYKGTGKALIGYLRKGETLQEFKERYKESIKRNPGHRINRKR